MSSNQQTKRKVSDIQFQEWRSVTVESLSDRFVDDYYVDAITDLCKNKPFSMEVCVCKVKYFFGMKKGTEFVCVVKVFNNNQDLFDYTNATGEDKFSEIFYSSI